jgi:aquaporin PIP
MSLRSDHGFTNFTSGIRAGWYKELRSRKFRQAVLAEMVASFLFLAFGTAAVVFPKGFLAEGESADSLSFLLIISLVFGMMIATLVYAVGDISGANINAAVSVSLFVSRKISLLRCCAYVVAQILGAVLGSAFIKSMNSTLFDAAGGASNGINWRRPGTTYWTALAGEALCTSLLVLVVHAAADVGREAHTKFVGAMTPLSIGFAVFLSHLFLVPITGCSINPSRSFGSALVSNNWEAHWVFWLGPIGGGLISCLVYELVFKVPLAPPPAPGSQGYEYGSVVTPSISRESSCTDLSSLNIDQAIAAHMASEAAGSGSAGSGGRGMSNGVSFVPRAALISAQANYAQRPDEREGSNTVLLGAAAATSSVVLQRGAAMQQQQPAASANSSARGMSTSVFVPLSLASATAPPSIQLTAQGTAQIPGSPSLGGSSSDVDIKEW